MFNRKNSKTNECKQATTVWQGEYSYIPMVRWNYFVDHVSELIERAERIKEDYEKNDSYILHLGVNKQTFYGIVKEISPITESQKMMKIIVNLT